VFTPLIRMLFFFIHAKKLSFFLLRCFDLGLFSSDPQPPSRFSNCSELPLTSLPSRTLRLTPSFMGSSLPMSARPTHRALWQRNFRCSHQPSVRFIPLQWFVVGRPPLLSGAHPVYADFAPWRLSAACGRAFGAFSDCFYPPRVFLGPLFVSPMADLFSDQPLCVRKHSNR